jgi:hypothetical protein
MLEKFSINEFEDLRLPDGALVELVTAAASPEPSKTAKTKQIGLRDMSFCQPLCTVEWMRLATFHSGFYRAVQVVGRRKYWFRYPHSLRIIHVSSAAKPKEETSRSWSAV